MSGENILPPGSPILLAGDNVRMACGCIYDGAIGVAIETCRRHDQRTREVKASAALNQMGLALAFAADEAGNDGLKQRLEDAAKYAVKAAKALIGNSDEG